MSTDNVTTTNTTIEPLTAAEVKETFGSLDVRMLLTSLDDNIKIIDDVAGQSLKAGDRKGVLLAMRVSSTLERARKSIKRSLDRANRLRKMKVNGVEVVVADDDDDDDTI